MRCLNCNAKIEKDSLFCSICGTKQEFEDRKCIECGTVLTKEVLFCPKCGTKQNDSLALKGEVYNILKDIIAKTKKELHGIKTVSYLNVTKKQLAEFKDACSKNLYRQKEFSEEDFVFAITRPNFLGTDSQLLFMTYGIKDSLGGSGYEIEYIDISNIDTPSSCRGSIYLKARNLPIKPCFGIAFPNYGNYDLIYEWERILQKLIDWGKSQHSDEDDFYEDNDYEEYKDTEDYNYEEQDICCLQNNSISIKEKKDKIHQMVLQYASQIGEKCVDWKVKNYETFPNDKKDLLLKIDCNFNYDDFATIFSIPNPLKLQLSAKFDYGIIFTIFGFYISTVDQLNSYTFVKYSEIVNCETIKNKHIKIYLSTELKGMFNSSENFIECGEYLAKPLSELLMKLKKIDAEFSTDYLTSVTSVRTDGLKTSRDRKYFMKGQINGYIRCSREYEMKLRKQADLFFTTANKWRKERAEYEALLDEYDATIVELEAKLSEAESPEYRRRLNNVVNYRDQLVSLSY